jgi:hypothetical protein
MFHTKVVQKIKTQCFQQGSFFKNHGYLMWENGVERGRQCENMAHVHGMLHN